MLLGNTLINSMKWNGVLGSIMAVGCPDCAPVRQMGHLRPRRYFVRAVGGQGPQRAPPGALVALVAARPGLRLTRLGKCPDLSRFPYICV